MFSAKKPPRIESIVFADGGYIIIRLDDGRALLASQRVLQSSGELSREVDYRFGCRLDDQQVAEFLRSWRRSIGKSVQKVVPTSKAAELAK